MTTSMVRRLGLSLVVAVAACDQPTSPLAMSGPAASLVSAAHRSIANGSYTIVAPPEVFGVLIKGKHNYSALRLPTGDVQGRFIYDEIYPDLGLTFTYRGRVTCFRIYDGTRAKVGGLIEESNDPAFPPGAFLWWQAKDNGRSDTDWSTFGGAGDEEENEAFCNSPNPPRFGPFTLQTGNVHIE